MAAMLWCGGARARWDLLGLRGKGGRDVRARKKALSLLFPPSCACCLSLCVRGGRVATLGCGVARLVCGVCVRERQRGERAGVDK